MRQWTSDTTKRAIRTFVQAFIGYLVVGIPLLDFSSGKDALKGAAIGLLISAVAAGIAGVMNLEYVPNGKPIDTEEGTDDVCPQK